MINLCTGLVMTADEHCFVVGKPRKSRGKGCEIQHPTYYTTAAQAVQGALLRAMHQAAADGSVTTLREFLATQEKLQADLQRLIAPLDGGQGWQNVGEGTADSSVGKDTPQPITTKNGPSVGAKREESGL